METKKLTVESVVEKIIWNEIVTGSSGTKDNTGSAKELMKVFLEQIRNELLEDNDFFEFDDCFFEYVSLERIKDVFNNYLNK